VMEMDCSALIPNRFHLLEEHILTSAIIKLCCTAISVAWRWSRVGARVWHQTNSEGAEWCLFRCDSGRQSQDYGRDRYRSGPRGKAAWGKYEAAILIGDLGDQNAIQRRDGFFDVFDKNKDSIQVVARISTEWNADKAFAGLVNALQANPGINFLVTSSDFLHPQIEQALKGAGKWKKRGEQGHVVFGGFGGRPCVAA
jgi:Periplasmic binding protein domain